MGERRVVYRPRSDATPEGELRALASIYAWLVEKHKERKQAAHAGVEDDYRRLRSVPQSRATGRRDDTA